MAGQGKWFKKKWCFAQCIFLGISIIPAICSYGHVLKPVTIRLFNFRSSSVVSLQVLPNRQKFEVYNATACDDCAGDIFPFFSISEFKAGKANRLIDEIKRTTGITAPEAKDAAARLNGLLKNQKLGKKLLEITTEKKIGSLGFSTSDFKNPRGPENLLKALQQKCGVDIPVAKTPLQSLNRLLDDKNLYKCLPKRSFGIEKFTGYLKQGRRLSPAETQEFNSSLVKSSVIKEFVGRKEQGLQIGHLETQLLNRFLLEANFPQETPKMQNVLSAVVSIRSLQMKGYLSPKEIRSLLEKTYPQQTPKSLYERYQVVRQKLPISVRDDVFTENNHLFPKDGTHLHLAFSADNKVYFGTPAPIGFDLMALDATSGKTGKVAHFYVGDYNVPHLRINTISVSPDSKKIAISMTSDPITLFGDSYHDLVILDISGQETKEYDLGNKACYGGWWSSSSDMFYTSCPIPEHSTPRYNEVCAIAFKEK